MNLLGIDFGTKRIGIALSINGIIVPLDPILNDGAKWNKIKELIEKHKINKIYVGLSTGPIASSTLDFVSRLRSMLQLSIETIEEAVSTIEADEIYRLNKRKRKDYDNNIDSIAAAVILRRIVN